MSVKLIVFREKDYYRLSKTILSPVVHDEGSVGDWEDPSIQHLKWDRFDWGFFSLCVEAGLTVAIRRATPEELEIYDKRLKELRHDLMEDPSVDISGAFPVYRIANQDDFGILVKKGLGL